MTSYRMRTSGGREKTIPESAVAGLATRLRGPLLQPGHSGYDEARRIWNGMIDKRPALIARCTDTADVVESVNFARAHDLLVSVRGGGHNIAGTALCDGGLMIDLSLMKDIQVDRERHRIQAGPGNTLGDLDRETQRHGLIVPGGIISTTGIAGYTLGGGFGWLTRKWGYTCDWLRAAEVVTWDGQVLTATPHNHPDLFWALAGGGGNFGIVTQFEYEAQALGPQVMAGIVFHPMDRVADVIQLYRDVTASAPEELTCLLVLRIAPPMPFIPAEMHGKPVVAIAVSYAGPLDEAEPHVRRVKEFGSPLVDTIAPKPFVEHQAFLDAGQPSGRHYYWKSDYFNEFSDELADALMEHCAKFTSPMSSTLIMHLGGAARRVPADATAMAHRDAEHIIAIQASWESAEESGRHIGWARDFFNDVQPHSSGGTYVNFLNADDGDDRTRQAYAPHIYDRLVDVKNRYDPENHFRMNKNIRPSVTAPVPTA